MKWQLGTAEEFIKTVDDAILYLAGYGHSFLRDPENGAITAVWFNGNRQALTEAEVIEEAQSTFRQEDGQDIPLQNRVSDPWPEGCDALVLVDAYNDYRCPEDDPLNGLPYLKAGTVVSVDSDEGYYLIVQEPGTPDLVLVEKDHVVPVPNCIDTDLDTIFDQLGEGSRLVSDLLSTGYKLDRISGWADTNDWWGEEIPESLVKRQEDWERFLQVNLNPGYNGLAILHGVEDDGLHVYITYIAWPTTFTVAYEA